MKSKINLSEQSQGEQHENPPEPQEASEDLFLAKSDQSDENNLEPQEIEPAFCGPVYRKRRLYVDKGVIYENYKSIGTVDVWKKDGLSKGYVYLDIVIEQDDKSNG